MTRRIFVSTILALLICIFAGCSSPITTREQGGLIGAGLGAGTGAIIGAATRRSGL